MPAVANFRPRCRAFSPPATTVALAASFCISQRGLILRSHRILLKGWKRQHPRNLPRLRFHRQALVFIFPNSTRTFICLHFLRGFSVHETGWQDALARREANRPARPKQRQQNVMAAQADDPARRLRPLLETPTSAQAALWIRPHMQLRFPTLAPVKRRKDGARSSSSYLPD